MSDVNAELEPRFRLKERIDALTAQIKAMRAPKASAGPDPTKYLTQLSKALTRAEKAVAKLKGQMGKPKTRRRRKGKVAE